MQIPVKNRSSKPLGHLESYLKSFLPFAQKRMGFNRPPYIFFDSDEQNSRKVLGKTAHYNPESMEVVVYVDGRHPKDVIRSLSHELVHHAQNCRGDLNSDVAGATELGYAQNNPHMRNMESEAYEKGNLCMRDWEDSVKVQLQETNYYHTRGDGKQMDKYKHIVETVAKRVAAKIREANASENNIEEGDAFAPNHYCVHHGGVRHEGKIHMAEAVGHNWNEESQSVTHYDMKLKDGSVLENVAFEDIQVTEASLAKEHNHPMKRDDELSPEQVKQAEDMLKQGLISKQEYEEMLNPSLKSDRGGAERNALGYDLEERKKPHDDGDNKDEKCDYVDCEEEELEERKKRDNPRNDRGMPSRMKMNEEEAEDLEEMYQVYDEFGNPRDTDEEQRMYAAELTRKEAAKKKAEKKAQDAKITNSARFQGENKEIEAGAEINESNDQWYQRNLFENLTKKWAK